MCRGRHCEYYHTSHNLSQGAKKIRHGNNGEQRRSTTLRTHQSITKRRINKAASGHHRGYGESESFRFARAVGPLQSP